MKGCAGIRKLNVSDNDNGWAMLLNDEIHYRILKAIEENPALSQRELASLLGISLGKANYCLKELVKKGWVKAGHFRSSRDKRAYAYLLTPSGIREKTQVTMRFLQKKIEEYDRIKIEIASLRSEVEQVYTTIER